jgi:glutamate racemase
MNELEDKFGVPVVGVIEPGVRSVAMVTQTGRIGVIGTVGAIASGAYQRTVARLAPGLELTCAACPGFVEFVERGETASDQVHVLAERLLAPLQEAKVDALLLGCTHYPFLARTISDVMGRDVVLVSSADETAFAVRAQLETNLRELGAPEQRQAQRDGDDGRRHRWLSSGDVRVFRELGRRLLGPELDHAEAVPWV